VLWACAAPCCSIPTRRAGCARAAHFDQADFGQLLDRAVAQGFQVATHAIGDAANRLVLDAYQKAWGGNGAARRFRVEHAQILTLTDVPRFKSLGVIPSMQRTHCTCDMYSRGLRAPSVAKAPTSEDLSEAGVPVAGQRCASGRSRPPGIYAITRQTPGWPPRASRDE
jgi:predicted amidohydrolase YtcJ